MECPVCIENFEITDMYTIKCKSSVPHRLCHPCETKLRLTSASGRLKCPICRSVETIESDVQSQVRLWRIMEFRMMLQTIEFMEQQQVEVQERLRNQHATNQRYAVLLAQTQQVPVTPTPVTPPPVRRRAAPITP